MKHLNIKNSIVIRLTSLFILIIIPLTTLGFVINNIGRDLIATNIINNASSISKGLFDRLDNELSRIYTLQTQIVSDAGTSTEIHQTNSYDDYNRVQQLIEIRSQINLIAGSSEYISDVRLHLPLVDKTISKSKGISSLLKEEYDYFIDKNNTSVSNYKQGVYPKDDKLYSVVFNLSFSLNPNKKPNAICVVELSNTALLGNMNVFSDDMVGNYLLISSDNKYTIGNYSVALNDRVTNELINQLSQNNSMHKKINNVKYLFIVNKNERLKLNYLCYISEKEMFREISMYQFYLLAFSFLILILLILFMTVTYQTIFNPVKTLVHGFLQAENGDFSVNLKRKHYDEFGYLFYSFNHMVKRLDILIKNEYQNQIAIQNSKLKQLQSQINPHFLYNSFFILKRRISGCDYENAESFAEYLGEYFKFITKDSSDYISLVTEYEHALTYTKIQAIRFKNKVKLVVEPLPGQYKNIIVPRLILQPIVENSFIHGFEKSNNFGEIHISFDDYSDPQDLFITIKNTSEPISKEQLDEINTQLHSDDAWDKEISGLANISWRLKLLYGSSYQLSGNYTDGFFQITVRIKKET